METAALAEALGAADLRLVDIQVRNCSGSWYEWESDPANPIERDEP